LVLRFVKKKIANDMRRRAQKKGRENRPERKGRKERGRQNPLRKIGAEMHFK